MINLGVCGIVAEFNPLHNGHKYLIDQAKNDKNTVICVISGNFVQRGDTAIVPKFTRAKMALSAGADVVVELPTPWSMSTAQNFAFGAISQLLAFNIDSLYFGSESSNLDELLRVSDILLSDEYKERISNKISDSSTYASIRSSIVSDILGYKTSVLDTPNDTLAIEYICAAKKLGTNIRFVPIRRIGAGHNDCASIKNISNATLIREQIIKGNINNIIPFLPVDCADFLLSSPISSINNLNTAIISRLKLLSKSDFEQLPDISEGIENLLYNNVRKAVDYNDLLSRVKTKRYTLARIRRLILSAFLGIDNRYFATEPPYVRVLGFKSAEFKTINYDFRKPVITKVSQINSLDNISRELFDLENLINEIYALSLDKPERFIHECNEKLIVE